MVRLLTKKKKAAQGAESENQEAMSAKRKDQGLKSYKKNYAERVEDFVIDTSRFTDEQRHSIEDEIGNGSITPKTFKSRKFFSEGEPRAAEEKGEEVNSLVSRIKKSIDQVQKDIRKEITEIRGVISKDSGFEGFGARGSEFEAKVTSLQTYEAELRQFRDFMTSNPGIALVYEDLYKNDTNNSVVRFGINAVLINADNASLLGIERAESQDTQSNSSKQSATSTQYTKGMMGNALKERDQAHEQRKMLHPLELSVIEKAIEHFNFGCSTVLVDIFRRAKQSNAVEFKDGNPEIHTVVLYNNPSIGGASDDNIIVIIDPSNSNFSRHLASDIDYRIFSGADREVVLIPSCGQIYTPGKKGTGFELELSRDCIDVAVKLAFGLNQFNDTVMITEFEGTKVVDLQEVEVIKEVQNTGKLGLPTAEEGWGPMRARQSSDDTLRTEVNKLIRLFDGQKKVMDMYGMQDKGLELVSEIKGYTPGRENYSLDLLDLYMSSAQELVGIKVLPMEGGLSGDLREDEGE